MSGMINGTQELHGELNAEGNLNGKMAVRQGVDGVSPTVNVMDITGEHHIFITDVNGSKTTVIYDGKDGIDGRDGIDGKDYILTEDDKNDIADLIIGEKAPAITETANGETITITDSSNAPWQSMNVFGKSWQKTVGGNQLLDAKSLIIANSNNYIFSNVKYSSEGVIPITGGQSYVLSLAKCLTDKGINVFDASNNKLSCTVTNKTVGEGITMSFTAPENAVSMSFYAKITTDGTTSVDLAKPMLNKGTSALPWEEYVGGIASPNPNYPQDIHSHGESGSIEYGILGKNLCPKNFLKKGWYGDGNTIGSPTTNAGYPDAVYGVPFDCRNKEPIAWNFGSTNATEVRLRTVSNGVITGYFQIFGTSGVVSLGANCDYIIPLFLHGFPDTCIIEYSDTVPTVDDSQSFLVQTPNGLNGLKVSSGGNYTDSNGQQWVVDYVDFERGKYVQRVNTYKITGNEGWNQHGNGTGFYCGWNGGQLQLSDGTHGMFTHFNKGNLGTNGNAFVGGNNIQLRWDSFANVSELKTWLQNNDVRFKYILATPIETDLTEEEIARYKATHTNYPSTTIINDANAYTEVGYVADTKMYIDNKFKELTSAMAQLL